MGGRTCPVRYCEAAPFIRLVMLRIPGSERSPTARRAPRNDGRPDAPRASFKGLLASQRNVFQSASCLGGAILRSGRTKQAAWRLCGACLRSGHRHRYLVITAHPEIVHEISWRRNTDCFKEERRGRGLSACTLQSAFLIVKSPQACNARRSCGGRGSSRRRARAPCGPRRSPWSRGRPCGAGDPGRCPG